MSAAKHTPEIFARAATFYRGQPTGQYDDEAAHALECHHEMLNALKEAIALADKNKAQAEANRFQVVRPPAMQAIYDKCVAAIARATGSTA